MKFTNPDVMLVDNVWQHFAFGQPLMAPIEGYQITREQFDMVLSKFEPVSDALEWHGYTRDQAWDYLVHEAPWAVGLVGIA